MHSTATPVDPRGAFSKLQRTVKAQNKERWTFLRNTLVSFLQVLWRAIRKLKVAQQQQLPLLYEKRWLHPCPGKPQSGACRETPSTSSSQEGWRADNRVTLTLWLVKALWNHTDFLIYHWITKKIKDQPPRQRYTFLNWSEMPSKYEETPTNQECEFLPPSELSTCQN